MLYLLNMIFAFLILLPVWLLIILSILIGFIIPLNSKRIYYLISFALIGSLIANYFLMKNVGDPLCGIDTGRGCGFSLIDYLKGSSLLFIFSVTSMYIATNVKKDLSRLVRKK